MLIEVAEIPQAMNGPRKARISRAEFTVVRCRDSVT
jgi:hypothetical protein